MRLIIIESDTFTEAVIVARAENETVCLKKPPDFGRLFAFYLFSVCSFAFSIA